MKSPAEVEKVIHDAIEEHYTYDENGVIETDSIIKARDVIFSQTTVTERLAWHNIQKKYDKKIAKVRMDFIHGEIDKPTKEKRLCALIGELNKIMGVLGVVT